MLSMFKQLWKDEEGPTAVEYAIMLALIALVIIAGAQLLGTNTLATFNDAAAVVPGAGG